MRLARFSDRTATVVPFGIIANRANDTENTFYARDKTLNLITLFQTRKVEKYAASKLISFFSCTAKTLSLLVDADFNYHWPTNMSAVLVLLMLSVYFVNKLDRNKNEKKSWLFWWKQRGKFLFGDGISMNLLLLAMLPKLIYTN